MNVQPFEKRYSLVLSHFPADHPTVVSFIREIGRQDKTTGEIYEEIKSLSFLEIIASRFLCSSAHILAECLQTILDGGGEGVVLRKPHSLYHFGRSSSLLKLKVFKFSLKFSFSLYLFVIIIFIFLVSHFFSLVNITIGLTR